MTLKSLGLALVLFVFASASAKSATESRDIITTSKTEVRVALVIGNNDYAYATKLATAVADARAIKRELEQRGFEIIYRENADLAAMNQAIGEFTGKLGKGAIGIVYYAGHGAGIKSENFLLPIDIAANDSVQLAARGIPLRTVLLAMKKKETEFSLAIIDACRNDPFPQESRALWASRSLRPASTASGVMVVYAAGTDQQALDNLGSQDRDPNGLFTREFVNALQTPGQSVQDIFRQVSTNVKDKAKSVGHTQTPAIYDESQGTFYFSGADRPPQPPLPPQQQVAAAVSPSVLPPPPVASLPPRLKPGVKFRECPDCPEMIVVPSGTFTMGSSANEEGRDVDEGPSRSVTIPRDFAVGIYDVTRAEFAIFARETRMPARENCMVWSGQGWRKGTAKDWRDPGFTQSDSDPAVCVSWDDAVRYVTWLNGRLRGVQSATAQTGDAGPYRLLSEAEWEYAARAGSKGRYAWGNGAAVKRANCNGCGTQWDGRQTSPAGSFAPNTFGLYDMHGNVWQWVADCYREDYSGAAKDPSAWSPASCEHRVDRGGAWSSPPRDLRAATRGGDAPTHRGNALGFRIARTLH